MNTKEPQPPQSPEPKPSAPPAPPPVPFAVSAAASALGRQGRGVPKAFTPEEIERRRQQMQGINSERAAKTAVAKGKVKRIAVAKGNRVQRAE